MYIKELLRKYNFHDSLIEDMSFKNDTLELTINLCNWKQKAYDKQDDEMINISLIFKDIRNFIFDVTEEKFDYDTILEFVCEDITNELYHKVKIVLDGDTNIKIIKFIGREVEVR